MSKHELLTLSGVTAICFWILLLRIYDLLKAANKQLAQIISYIDSISESCLNLRHRD